MFLFNLRNIYSTNSVSGFCPFQFSSESKEMQTLYCWHSRMETKGYLVAWNCDNVVEVTTKGSPSVFARNLVGCSLKQRPRFCLNTLGCLFASHFLIGHCHRLTTWLSVSPTASFWELRTWNRIAYQLRHQLGQSSLKPLLNILLTSTFSSVMKENMLLKGNKLLLFESKESTQPAGISARQNTRKLWLILENEKQ